MWDLILLDRDGVINKDLPTGVTNPEDFELLPGVGKAIARLNHAHIPVCIVTNQSVLGKQLVSYEDFAAIHQKMHGLLAQDGAYLNYVVICGDHPNSPSQRRKPAPGMIMEALDHFDAHPQRTPFIGDALRDLEAAFAAGCPRHLVLTGKGAQTLQEKALEEVRPFMVHKDLPSAIDSLLEGQDA